MWTACETAVKTAMFTLVIKSVFSTSLRRSLSSESRDRSVGRVTKIRGGRRPPAEAKELELFSTVAEGPTQPTYSMVNEGYCLDRKAAEAQSWPLFSLHLEVRIRRITSLPVTHYSVLKWAREKLKLYLYLGAHFSRFKPIIVSFFTDVTIHISSTCNRPWKPTGGAEV